MINYRWENNPIGTWNHIAVYIGNGQVASHTASHYGAVWQLSGAAEYRFIHIIVPAPPTSFNNHVPVSKMVPQDFPQEDPSALWNAMIYPITKYSITAVLWYQGKTIIQLCYSLLCVMVMMMTDDYSQVIVGILYFCCLCDCAFR